MYTVFSAYIKVGCTVVYIVLSPTENSVHSVLRIYQGIVKLYVHLQLENSVHSVLIIHQGRVYSCVHSAVFSRE